MSDSKYPKYATNDEFVGGFQIDKNDGWMSHAELHPNLIDPTKIDLRTFVREEDRTRVGEYTLNPEMQAFTDSDFEKMVLEGRVKIVNPFDSNRSISRTSKVDSITLAEAALTFSKTHYIPGIEFLRWLENNPEKAPSELRVDFSGRGEEGFLTFGSFIRGYTGVWSVMRFVWTNDKRFSFSLRHLTAPLDFGVHHLTDILPKVILISRE